MDIENLRQAIKVDLDAALATQKINHAMSRIGGRWNATGHVGSVGPHVCFPSMVNELRNSHGGSAL